MAKHERPAFMNHMYGRKRQLLIPAILAIAVLMLSVAVSAGEFVSFKGKCKISFPENWAQIDYRTADLRISQAGGDIAYEAAFACSEDAVVFEGRYFILTVDTSGELTAPQIDSALNGVATDFGKSVREVASDMFLVNPPEDAVSYCPQLRAAAVYSHLDAGTPESRKNVVLRKFYDHGTADFYFYSPDSTFEQGLADMLTVLTSFTTENLTVAAGEPVQVGDGEKGGMSRSLMLVIIGVLMVAVIVIWLLKRRNASK
jgi:hypothetical protein